MWLVTVWNCDVIALLHLAGTPNFPSLGRSVEKFTATVWSVLLMASLCRHLHCTSCGTSTDRQTLMPMVILSFSLLKAVYCVPSVTESRHYTVLSAGYRLRHVGDEISC